MKHGNAGFNRRPCCDAPAAPCLVDGNLHNAAWSNEPVLNRDSRGSALALLLSVEKWHDIEDQKLGLVLHVMSSSEAKGAVESCVSDVQWDLLKNCETWRPNRCVEEAEG